MSPEELRLLAHAAVNWSVVLEGEAGGPTAWSRDYTEVALKARAEADRLAEGVKQAQEDEHTNG